MSAYEEILHIMREQGKKDNTMPIQKGKMKNDTTCIIGDLELSKEDFLVAEHLKTGYHYAVYDDKPSRKDEGSFIDKLKAGDEVAVYRLNDEQYLILERLVQL